MSTRVPVNVLATTYSYREVAEDIEAILAEHEGEDYWEGGVCDDVVGIKPLPFTKLFASDRQVQAKYVIDKHRDKDEVADAPCVAFLAAPVNEALTELWETECKLNTHSMFGGWVD